MWRRLPVNSVGEVRLAGAAGIAFSVVFVVYLVLVDVPDMTSSVDQAVAFYQDPRERLISIVGGYVGGLAGVFFLLLVVGCVRDVRGLGREAEALVAAIAGGVFVALHLAAAALFVAPSAPVDLNNETVVVDGGFATAARTGSMIGDSVLLVSAAFAAGVFVAAVSAGVRGGGGRWPRWVSWFGLVTALVLASPLLYFSLLLLLLWSLLLGVRFVIRAGVDPSLMSSRADFPSPR
jgi:hypothetical protein